MLRKDIDANDSKAVAGDLKQIGSATDKMAQLLNELLDLSRIGRLMNTPEQVVLGDLAREAVNRAEPLIDQRRIEIEIGKRC